MAPKGPPEQRGQNDFTPSSETVAMLKERAKFVRLETIRLIDIAKTGHYTSAFSAAEIFASLFYDVMTLRQRRAEMARLATASLWARATPPSASSRFSPISASSPRPGSTSTRASAVRSATTPTCARCRASTSRRAPSATRLSGGLGMCLAQR